LERPDYGRGLGMSKQTCINKQDGEYRNKEEWQDIGIYIINLKVNGKG
jgi:hypothetical protein